jgi:phage tail sheath protein FI
MATTYSTPGVYINEINGFPNSVMPVATAVPAFIGYTPAAAYQGKSYVNKATLISSFAEFQAIFMFPDPAPPADPVQQYSPQYYLAAQTGVPDAGTYVLANGVNYSILPDPDSIYYLYNSVRLFFQNGGASAYIVAVGSYGAPGGKPLASPDLNIVNRNVQLADLQRGLALLMDEAEPTMYICPEATLLSLAENATLMQSMLLQATSMQTAVCIFDVIGGAHPNPVTYTGDIENFRNGTGSIGLNYGVCYYPFIGTSVMQANELDFTNLFGGDISKLAALLNPPGNANPAVAQILALIEKPEPNPAPNPPSRQQLQDALLMASPVYRQIMQGVLKLANTLPPSGAMAGVYTTNDNNEGVWNAPANTSIVGAVNLPIDLSDAQQSNLNIDAVSGKSVNAIRSFPGHGILIWGARTLDGNSQDWRYVPVRRTMIFLEQSIKQAARAYVFEPNNANTWAALKRMISSFLSDVWKQGGLTGATSDQAFNVSIGLGTTMTADDILNGYMNVSVQVAVTHPAEFLEITFQQLQAQAG